MRIGPALFAWETRTYLMGVINVSPESFSGDGLASADEAMAQARRMLSEGADVLDIGGQSTRPAANRSDAGFDEITPEVEIRRVAPVIERLRAELPEAPISVDTYKPAVAEAALAAGAHMLNDIMGLRGDPAMARIAAAAGVSVVVMHNQRGRTTRDVIGDITVGLTESVRIAERAGIPAWNLVGDPGFGFGWMVDENTEMLRRLSELNALALPLLVGTSRKSTIGTLLGGVPAEERIFGTAASVALSIAGGADIVRVHDVAAMKQVALVADAIVRPCP